MYIKEFNVKKKFKINILALIIVIIAVLIITAFCLYRFNEWFRDKVNSIFIINQSVGAKVSTIDISQDKIGSMVSYDKYISILSQSKLSGYSNSNTPEYINDINITDCISSSCDNYLALAQKNENKIYLLHGKDILFDVNTDGTVINVSVNKNGYVAVNMLKSGYRSVVVLYNPEGNILFTTYLASTYVSDMKISNNNKELALIEIDTSGIKIVSRIKLVEINKVSQDDSIKQLVEESDSVIANISFANNSDIIYITQSKISKVDLNGKNEVIYELNNNDIINVDISLGSYIGIVQKVGAGIFNTKTDIKIIDKNGNEAGKYQIDGTVKTLAMRDNILCIGIGQEVHFITVTGRLIKKYKTTMDIKDVLIYNNGNMAALIYRNKIELINI